ncbi:MAG: hypothetical protein U0Y96_08415 [Candidatus Kapaibacterium sp.]|nr:hypothetical protein [Bacteroidota bacterium]
MTQYYLLNGKSIREIYVCIDATQMVNDIPLSDMHTLCIQFIFSDQTVFTFVGDDANGYATLDYKMLDVEKLESKSCTWVKIFPDEN